jgi:hypothetical protein
VSKDIFPIIKKVLIFGWSVFLLVLLVSGLTRFDNKTVMMEPIPIDMRLLTKEEVREVNKESYQEDKKEREVELKEEQNKNSQEWQEFLGDN